MAAVSATPISLTPGVLAESVVDLGAIQHNVRVLREHAGSAQVMAVVKADAYGHGAVEVAKAALAAGAAELGVATIDEALALVRRHHSARAGLAASAPNRLRSGAAGRRADRGVVGEAARRALGAVRRTGRAAAVTLKVDTGLNRNGVPLAQYPSMLDALGPAIAEDAIRAAGSHVAHGLCR